MEVKKLDTKGSLKPDAEITPGLVLVVDDNGEIDSSRRGMGLHVGHADFEDTYLQVFASPFALAAFMKHLSIVGMEAFGEELHKAMELLSGDDESDDERLPN